jgi:hypothetical protein
MDLSIGSLAAFSLGGLAFAADIIAVGSYIKSIRLGQYSEAPIKVMLIVSIFIVGIALVYIGKSPNGINHSYFLGFFSFIYFALSFLTLFLASSVLKGSHSPAKDYFAYAGSSLIIYILGVILLFLTGKYAPALAYVFFFCATVQCFYLAGEYGLKRVLVDSSIKLERHFMSEYPHFVNLVIEDIKGLKKIISSSNELIEVDGLEVDRLDKDHKTTLRALSYKHLSLDSAIMAFTFILGVGLLIFNNSNVFVINLLGGV